MAFLLKLLLIAAAAAAMAGRAAAQYRMPDPRSAMRGYVPRRGPEARAPALRGDDARFAFAGGRGAAPPYGADARSFGYGRYGGARGWNRGQYLPPDYRGARLADPGRYHLRAPPSGYGWVGDGRNAYLMQRSTGMVLDLVPRAYERPAPSRPRR